MNSPMFNFFDFNPGEDSFSKDIHAGLSATPRQTPPKYFYDEAGSKLFDQICHLEEYYPTRTEVALLQKYSEEIADIVGENTILIEFGSGSSIKTRLLLNACKPRIYIPLDISGEHLLHSARTIAENHPWLRVDAMCVDYLSPWTMPDYSEDLRRIAFFPGSSIGNFEPDAACQFMERVAALLDGQGGFLIGVDLKKDPALIESAYNDSEEVTAAFNKNLLTRINRELDGDFSPTNFDHQAYFNQSEGRIEMHLKSNCDHTVSVGHSSYHFEKGDSIHTENSYKYSSAEFQQLAEKAGFRLVKIWKDSDELFSIVYLKPG